MNFDWGISHKTKLFSSFQKLHAMPCIIFSTKNLLNKRNELVSVDMKIGSTLQTTKR